MRTGDTIGRFGGDEFVALLVDAGSSDVVESACDRVLAAIDTPVRSGRHGEVTITASIGVAISGSGDDADELIRRADAAMYRAKADGRARTFRAPDRREYGSGPLREMTQS